MTVYSIDDGIAKKWICDILLKGDVMELYNDYLTELKKVYENFYSDDGKCPYYEMCSKNIAVTKYSFDYTTRVGVEYGKYDLPRVLFIGQEGTDKHNEFFPPADSLDNVSKYHYPRTLWTLTKIYTGENINASDLKKEVYTKYLKTLSLTNYYKCAFFKSKPKNINLNSGLYHTSDMKLNFYKLLLSEIEILQPDLIVVQGQFTNKYFWNGLNYNFGKGSLIYINSNKKIELYKHQNKNRTIYIIYSYHPAGRSGRWVTYKSDLETAIESFRKEYNK